MLWHCRVRSVWGTACITMHLTLLLRCRGYEKSFESSASVTLWYDNALVKVVEWTRLLCTPDSEKDFRHYKRYLTEQVFLFNRHCKRSNHHVAAAIRRHQSHLIMCNQTHSAASMLMPLASSLYGHMQRSQTGKRASKSLMHTIPEEFSNSTSSLPCSHMHHYMGCNFRKSAASKNR